MKLLYLLCFVGVLNSQRYSQRIRFTDVEAEAQRGQETRIRSHSKVSAESDGRGGFSITLPILHHLGGAELTNGCIAELRVKAAFGNLHAYGRTYLY